MFYLVDMKKIYVSDQLSSIFLNFLIALKIALKCVFYLNVVETIKS